jgi:hypothetical protein
MGRAFTSKSSEGQRLSGIESAAKGIVDDALERPSRPQRGLAQALFHIPIQRHGLSHHGIRMLWMIDIKSHNVKSDSPLILHNPSSISPAPMQRAKK